MSPNSQDGVVPAAGGLGELHRRRQPVYLAVWGLSRNRVWRQQLVLLPSACPHSGRFVLPPAQPYPSPSPLGKIL